MGIRRQPPTPPKAFTLVEIMIVVVIVGVLASLAVPAFLRIHTESIATRLANDYRTFRNAFEVYYLENGGWPEDSHHGQLPPEMDGYLTGFTEPAPTGDSWDWDRNAVGAVAGVSLQGGATSERVMLRVDEILDDGDLSTGRIFRGQSDRFTFELW